MPMLDATIPSGALSPAAEERLLAQLTDLLLIHEGAPVDNPRARSLAWVFVQHPTAVYVAGERAQAPHYRITASVPEGQFDDDRRSAMVAAVTEAVLDAEEGSYPRDPFRVWVMMHEVPEGNWGAAGQVYRLKDIAGFVLDDADAGAAYAGQRLGERRRQAAGAVA